MKILLVTPYFYPHKGGSQKYAEELYFHLMKLDQKLKVDVLCYNTDKVKKKEIYQGFTIYRVPCIEILPGQFALPNYFRLTSLLIKLAKKNKYDFINSHTRFFDSAWWTPLVTKLFHSRSILTDHCAGYPKHRSRLITIIARYIDRVITPLVSNWYDLVTVTNKATDKFVSRLGVKKTRIVYGGVDTNYFRPKTVNSIKRIPGIYRIFSKKDILVTFVGRMISTKGPDLLFRSAKEITKNNTNIYFVFIGGGEVYQRMKKSQTKKIFFLGPLEKKEIAQVLSITDILVHPSIHHEGFPNVLLEAGASEVAVIATDKGGTREIIDDNKNGIIIKPNVISIKKAILNLARNKKKRNNFGKLLRKKIKENYSWPKIAQDFRNILLSFDQTYNNY